MEAQPKGQKLQKEEEEEEEEEKDIQSISQLPGRSQSVAQS